MLAKFGDSLFVGSAEKNILIALPVIAIVCTVAVIALSIVVIVMLKKRKAGAVRELADLTVDASAAKCDFTVGEDFECEGLRIVANYTLEPKEETLTEYKVVTEEELAQSGSAGEANGCYVVKPKLAQSGEETVTVKYMGKTASYTVTVSESVPEAQTPAEQTEQA